MDSKKTMPKGIKIAALVIIPIAAAVLVIAMYTGRTQPVWFVEAGYEDQWAGILASVPTPPPFTKIETWKGDEIPQSRYGYIITAKREKGEEPQPFVRVYPDLGLIQEFEGAIVLALDPWMVFRDTADPPLTRSRTERVEGGNGFLVGIGSEPAAVSAWCAQLLQSDPGVFSEEKEAWDRTKETLFRGGRFQNGALTYNWNDAWRFFSNNKPAWIYAPLSGVLRLPERQTSQLEAIRFPVKRDWKTFGIEAEILWAVPFGNNKNPEKSTAWLKSPETQTVIAEILNWIPAHKEGRSPNSLARSAHTTWLMSSYVWELTDW
jgi:hypothetical protein